MPELTTTELETLAVMLSSGARRMGTARNRDGEFAWTSGNGLTDAIWDMASGFYELQAGRDPFTGLVPFHG